MTTKLRRSKERVLPFDYFRRQASLAEARGSPRSASLQPCDLPETFRTLTADAGLQVMAALPAPADLNPAAFTALAGLRKSPLLCALASVLNSDAKYQTSSLRRLVYPHRGSLPCRSEAGVYHVKLIVNGMRRCFPVDGIVNQSVFFTKKREVYPFLLEKALSHVYPDGALAGVAPNLLVYRMVGWIPETLNYMEIGDPKSAFEKLRQNMQSFAIIISFDWKDRVLPLLDLFLDPKTQRRVAATLATDAKDPSGAINTRVWGAAAAK